MGHAETMQAVARSDVSKAQEELRRVIADREKMQRLLLDAEDRARETAAKYENRIAEVEKARKAAEERATAADRVLRTQNAELLEKQQAEHTVKVGSEMLREKDRQSALLRRKDQELQVATAQIKSLKARLEQGCDLLGPARTRC